jgi:hypothetical protein
MGVSLYEILLTLSEMGTTKIIEQEC